MDQSLHRLHVACPLSHWRRQLFDLLCQRCSLRRLARLLAAPLSTVGRTLNLIGLGRLKNLEPLVPVPRCQWAQSCDMIQVDIKELARFIKWATDHWRWRLGLLSGAGYAKSTSPPMT